MKRTIKETPKKRPVQSKNTRPHSTKQAGYKEDVFNAEEAKDYEKTDLAKNTRRNTAGPKS